jgi:DNA-binding response OmpR family regulator
MLGEDSQKRNALILVVDDDQIMRLLSREALEQASFGVIEAEDGAQALSMSMSLQPDLIMLDIMMPGMDGFEVCARLKANERTKDVPVIFLTGKGDEEDEAKGLDLGAVDYITKPFSPAIVKARVQTHLELKQQRDMLQALLQLTSRELEQTRQEYMALFLRGNKKMNLE